MVKGIKLFFFKLFLLLKLAQIIRSMNISSNHCYRNERSNRDPRIVGGNNTKRNEVPFMISLKFRGGHLCGGSIVNEKWVLTAAHCLCNGFNEPIKASSLRGIAGLYKISEQNINTTGSYEFGFIKAIVHPEYKCTNTANDLALLEVENPLNFNQNIKPVCFEKYSVTQNLYESSLATVLGWGWTNEDRSIGVRSDILQKAKVKIWNNKECQNSFINKNKKNKIMNTHICAGYEDGGVDSCWADSGGPLMSKNILIGVVSTGIGCARPGLPGIYTRVYNFHEWIKSTIENN